MESRVLIADDDPDIVDAISTSMQRLGAQVVCVTSGAELLDRLAEGGVFDLVISDVSMPWMTGIEVAHSMRAAGLDIPVLLISGSHAPALVEQVRMIGGRTLLLPKPFDRFELERAIEALISQDVSPSETPSELPVAYPRLSKVS